MALFAMASCSDDNGVTPDVPGDNGGVKGDLYMTMNITQSQTINSRADYPDTQTGYQGVEIGKDSENTITTALIIFASPKTGDSNGQYTIDLSIPVGPTAGQTNSDATIIPGNNQTNLAVFEVDRATLQTKVGDSSKEFSIFVVANPTSTMITDLAAGNDLQQTFSLLADKNNGQSNFTDNTDTWWKANNFLMSNSEVCTREITAAEIVKGTHTTASTALHLGTVKIQRAVSRFDIETDDEYTQFDISNANSDYEVSIELVGVSLINQATTANLFKVTDVASSTKVMNFADETTTNWVWSPTQTAFTLPLFGSGAATGGKLTGDRIDLEGLTYTALTSLTTDDNVFTYPNSTPAPSIQGTYKIWRYAMENTNPDDAENQINGNSTGVVFKAKMTANKAGSAVNAPVYAYNSVILGTFEDLATYVASPKAVESGEGTGDGDPGIYDMVQIRWNAVIDAYNAKQSEDSKLEKNDSIVQPVGGGSGTETEKVPNPKFWGTEANVRLLKASEDVQKELVKQEFSIFRPSTDGNFYCYYIYWNRHNNNGLDTEMGPMEFATVRNNVYKLRVTEIYKLGHPGKPDDDPENPTPDTPDEKDHLFLDVEVQVLPWEVRINDIIF